MTATSNPAPSSYKWSRLQDHTSQDEVLQKDAHARVHFEDGILNISEVTREDSGYYTISATNEEGTTMTKIRVEVLYPPR